MIRIELTLVKTTGDVTREDVPALVSGATIFIADETLPVEVNDHILRTLPSGLVEDYVVVDRLLLRGSGGDGFSFSDQGKKARIAGEQGLCRSGDYEQFSRRKFAGQHQLSRQLRKRFGLDILRRHRYFISQVLPVIEHLPEGSQSKVREQLDVLSEEEKKDSPSQLRCAARCNRSSQLPKALAATWWLPASWV